MDKTARKPRHFGRPDGYWAIEIQVATNARRDHDETCVAAFHANGCGPVEWHAPIDQRNMSISENMKLIWEEGGRTADGRYGFEL